MINTISYQMDVNLVTNLLVAKRYEQADLPDRTPQYAALNPDGSEMLNPDGSTAHNPT